MDGVPGENGDRGVTGTSQMQHSMIWCAHVAADITNSTLLVIYCLVIYKSGPGGVKGQRGQDGEKGIVAANGDKGYQGDTGMTGPQGAGGDVGATGPAGMFVLSS